MSLGANWVLSLHGLIAGVPLLWVELLMGLKWGFSPYHVVHAPHPPASSQQIMKDKWINIGYEGDELKPYKEPEEDFTDAKRIGRCMSGLFFHVAHPCFYIHSNPVERARLRERERERCGLRSPVGQDLNPMHPDLVPGP